MTASRLKTAVQATVNVTGTGRHPLMEGQNQSTIKDIAKRAGVSIATVDRVLHNRGNVSPEKLAAINEAISSLNYKPNQIARALSSRRGGIRIGLALPNVESDFWNEIIAGVQESQKKLAPFGVELISDYTYNYELDDQIRSIDRLLAQNIQGLLIVPLYDGFGSRISHHIPDSIPYATIINDLPRSSRLFHIGPDDFGIGSLAARLTWLYCQGHGNVVILAPNHPLIETQNRISGFVSKINQEKMDLQIMRVVPVPGKTEDVMYRKIYDCTLDCIRENPNIDAFYVTNGLTEWCAKAVTDSAMGRKCKIIGHEVTSGTFDYLQNDIIQATIYQRPAQQVMNAIDLMYRHLSEDTEITESRIVSECSIIIKENLEFSNLGGIEYGNRRPGKIS